MLSDARLVRDDVIVLTPGVRGTVARTLDTPSRRATPPQRRSQLGRNPHPENGTKAGPLPLLTPRRRLTQDLIAGTNGLRTRFRCFALSPMHSGQPPQCGPPRTEDPHAPNTARRSTRRLRFAGRDGGPAPRWPGSCPSTSHRSAVPTDGSLNALAALRPAPSVVRRGGGQVTLLMWPPSTASTVPVM